mmetsp:Transcript_8238/g.32476  ORF Transcript_8238/g.32476 Transcript_8238/m.32476 type:complete len:205 (+) Transcript_8238:685-1299(+)
MSTTTMRGRSLGLTLNCWMAALYATPSRWPYTNAARVLSGKAVRPGEARSRKPCRKKGVSSLAGSTTARARRAPPRPTMAKLLWSSFETRGKRWPGWRTHESKSLAVTPPAKSSGSCPRSRRQTPPLPNPRLAKAWSTRWLSATFANEPARTGSEPGPMAITGSEASRSSASRSCSVPTGSTAGWEMRLPAASSPSNVRGTMSS